MLWHLQHHESIPLVFQTQCKIIPGYRASRMDCTDGKQKLLLLMIGGETALKYFSRSSPSGLMISEMVIDFLKRKMIYKQNVRDLKVGKFYRGFGLSIKIESLSFIRITELRSILILSDFLCQIVNSNHAKRLMFIISSV